MKRNMKKVLALALSAGLALGGTLPYGGTCYVQAASNVNDGLAGYWSFDGTTEDAQMTNQVSGGTCTAEKSGSGVTLKQEEGISGGAIYFGKQADSYLKLDANMNASTDDFTLAAWVKYDSDAFSGTSDSMTVFQQTADITNTSAQGRSILFLNNSLKYGTFLAGSNVIADQGITVNQWHHVAVSYDHTTKTFKIYVNGTLVKESTLSGDVVDAATSILVGSHKTKAASTAMKGCVDELRYYSKAVDADTVQALYDEFADKLTTEETESSVISIDVDTSDEVQTISSAMFGINHRYHKYGYGSWDITLNGVAEEFDSLVKEANFGSVRYPGGTVSNLFTWKDSIGEDRTTTIAGNNFYSSAGETPVDPAFGLD
jgi:hypothetical protein